MQYLVADRSAIDRALVAPSDVVAHGEMIVLEGPWPWGSPVVARLDDAALDDIRAMGPDGYAAEALADPGPGQAFVLAAHRMRDTEGFRPYADRIEAVVARFGGRFLARAGKVTLFGGAFAADRAVIIEFPHAGDAVAFYVSDIYASLLNIRHATTDPRFVVIARAGALPAAARATADSYLRARAASSH
jgi:uncharacterized protein (DUF1330 family)